MTKIKICGIRLAEDAVLCAELGADFVGFIFVPSSPRFVEPEQAAQVALTLREQAHVPRIVGVFRDASPEYIREIDDLVKLDLVQLHGTETDEDIQALSLPAVKAFRVGDALPDTTSVPSAEWLLFDSYDERRAGGTGKRFDWSLLALYPRTQPFFLAGGLGPENIAAAISLVRPDAVDVSSGVESQPGVKDPGKLRSLFERVRRA